MGKPSEHSLRSESQRSAASSTSVEQPSTPAASPQRMAAAADLQPAFSAGSFDLEWAQNVTPEPQASLAAPQHFLLPRQLRMTPQERFLKVLVVGRKGLGKTTWISNMQAVYGSPDAAMPEQQADESEAHAESEDSQMLKFLKDPCHMLSEMTLRDDSSHVTHHICMQDTPGYAKDIPVKHVTSYIRQQGKHYFDMEQSPGRRVPVSALPDTRIDVCLFFMPSTPLRSHDMAALSEIGALVPIVPVIAKADVLDTDELQRVRTRIMAAMEMMRVNDGLDCRHSFPADDIIAAGGPPSQIFAVIGGNVLEDFEGRRWPARKYTWGKCETLLPENSDVLALSRLLFELSIADLKHKTEMRYLELRRRGMRNKSKRTELEMASKVQQLERNQQAHVNKLAAKLHGMQVRVLSDARKHEKSILKKQLKRAASPLGERLLSVPEELHRSPVSPVAESPTSPEPEPEPEPRAASPVRASPISPALEHCASSPSTAAPSTPVPERPTKRFASPARGGCLTTPVLGGSPVVTVGARCLTTPVLDGSPVGAGPSAFVPEDKPKSMAGPVGGGFFADPK